MIFHQNVTSAVSNNMNKTEDDILWEENHGENSCSGNYSVGKLPLCVH